MGRGATPNKAGLARACAAVAAWLVLLVPPAAFAASAGEEYENLSLEQAIERLGGSGLQVLYSSDLVKPWMRVREAPAAAEPRGILIEILKPYQLGVEDGPDGSVVIVREPAPAPVPPGGIRGVLVRRVTGEPVPRARLRLSPGRKMAVTDANGRFEFRRVPPGQHRLELVGDGTLATSRLDVRPGEVREMTLEFLPAAPPDLAEVVVSASRYELFRHTGPSSSVFTAADLEALPEIGDDGLRAVARLPGTAGIDVSAKSNVRGGEVDETLVRFDGLRLYNPFHLKDFQSLFSAIDPNLIEELNIYTGGFPATYGDRMSSVIDITPLAPGEEPYRELTLSFFNASALATGNLNDGKTDWLVSARRGNLDLVFDVFDPNRGDPSFVDLHARVGHRFSDQFRVAANVLIFDDDIRIFDDGDEERAKADYRDEYVWLRFDLSPSDVLDGSLLVSHLDMSSKRSGSATQEGIANGTLNDKRDFDITMVSTDWSWRATERLLVQAGGELRDEEGNYDFHDEAQFEILFLTPGTPDDPVLITDLIESPSGRQYGLYGNLRFDLLDWLTTEAGLRWDKETLTESNDQQFSPRLSVLVTVGERTSLRFSWGRFFQAQSVNELQISDGVTEFFPPQRADHWIASLEHAWPSGVDLRVEAFRKEYRDPRPRYENLLNTLIVLPELKPDRVRIAPDKATAEGVEVTLSRIDEEPLAWWLSYTWSSIEDDFGHAQRPRSWDQTYTVNAGISWRSDRWELSLAGTYHRGWPTTSAFLVATDPIPLADTGPRNGQRMNDFRSVDLRVARKYELERRGRITVFGQLNNMFNWQNNCCIQYEVEADEDTGELFLDLENQHGLPIVPSLGVTWQF